MPLDCVLPLSGSDWMADPGTRKPGRAPSAASTAPTLVSAQQSLVNVCLLTDGQQHLTDYRSAHSAPLWTTAEGSVHTALRLCSNHAPEGRKPLLLPVPPPRMGPG